MPNRSAPPGHDDRTRLRQPVRQAPAGRAPSLEWSEPAAAAAPAEETPVDTTATGRYPIASPGLAPPPRPWGGKASKRRPPARRPQLTSGRLIKGCALLVVAGTLFGTHQPLARMAMLAQPHPLGLSFWVNIVTAILCLGFSASRGRLSWPRGSTLRFLLAWGVIGAAAGEVILFWVAGALPASLLSVILALEGFMVFGWSLARGRDHTSLRRFLGLACGLIGVALLVSHYGSMAATGKPAWLLLALLVPLAYALEDVLIVERMPPRLDLVSATGFASLFGALCLLPVAMLFGDMIHLPSLQMQAAMAVLFMALTSAVATTMVVVLLKRYGAVFGSQIGHLITLTGVLWSVVLLGEVLPWQIWPALALLSIGVWLVTGMQAVRARQWPRARTVV